MPGVNERAILGTIVGGIPGLIRDAGEVKTTAEKVFASTDVIPGFDPFTNRSSSNKPNNGGGGTVSAAAAEDTRQRNFTIGQLQDQIAQLDAAIGSLAGYESSGLNQINDGYSKGMSRLNQQRSNALTRYNT